MAEQPKLTFKVAPHIVEDLGLNLYTSLPRVLVEFIANAYDADSPVARITFDKEGIDQARRVIRQQYKLDVERAKSTSSPVVPLTERILPDEFKIVVEDAGCGMSRDELNDKFLVAGRRRLLEEPETNGQSPHHRPLMGRKGLGKLAGFGVARRVEIVTRKEGESNATRIRLDYDKLVEKRAGNVIEIDDEVLADGGGFPEKGTRVILSRLLYDPLKSRAETIENAIADYFDLIDPDDFAIYLNGGVTPIQALSPDFAYAWPQADFDKYSLIDKTLDREDGGQVQFRYRIRFTGEGASLPAARRGIRVYVNKRLAAMPSLLGADTNMHGFRMTDYLDGTVHADFLAAESTDYIATDRQSLRWESPLLSDMHDFLSEEIKKACSAYQKLRDDTAPNVVKGDSFTQAEIARHAFSKKDRNMAIRLAVVLKNSAKRGVEDPEYKQKLPLFLRSIGQGNIIQAITQLAEQPLPDIHKVAIEIARLAADEMDQFAGYARARLKAIYALQKIVRDVNFKASQNEKVIQGMLEKSPWMLDPTYAHLLAGDTQFDVVLVRLARALGITTDSSGNEDDDERPDLVFLLGGPSHAQLVIVELKSANKPLESKYLDQLMAYMDTSREWLNSHGRPNVSIEGHLVGSMADPDSRLQGVRALKRRIDEAGPETSWSVRDYTKVLDDTMSAHQELISIHEKLESTVAADDGG